MRLTAALCDEVLAHCRDGLPNEACGLLVGPPGGPITRHVPMRNTTPSQHRYTVDPAEQLAIYEQLDDRGEDPLVVYHSHPQDRAYPSPTDIKAAQDPAPHYLIVSLRREPPVMRCWRIVHGLVMEEPIEIV